MHVVATTTVFADLVAQVGGDRVSVRSLVPAGGEPHTFDPRPSDVTAFKDADLVVMNGLGLDDWVVNLMSDAGSEAPVIALAEDLPGADYIAGGEAGGTNPHLWLNVAYAIGYVDRIEAALSEVYPEGPTAMRSVPMGTARTSATGHLRSFGARSDPRIAAAASSRFMTHFPISQRRMAWRWLAPWSRRRARIRAPAR